MDAQRTGKYVRQPQGYDAFMPKPLPPDPPLVFDRDLQSALSEADRSLARLDGVAAVLPNPELFIAMYVKKEALLSSQIEGTQASLQGILEFEADGIPRDDINEIKEVINYVKAMDHGLARLKDFPFSSRLFREIHALLLAGVRGRTKTPGEYRCSQNWIGGAGAPLAEAVFVPPPADAVEGLISDLEKFIHAADGLPPLVKIALVHAQFETIHPFLDGNGRIGRLLITFYLCWQGILSRPLLYLSYYLKKNRQAYYDKLLAVRTEGDWEGWVGFFLRGVKEVSLEAADTARRIIDLKSRVSETIHSSRRSGLSSLRLLDLSFAMPLLDVPLIASRLALSRQSATQLVDHFQSLGILHEITGKKRYRKFIFREYVGLIAKGTELG
jgi:Fic family protein